MECLCAMAGKSRERDAQASTYNPYSDGEEPLDVAVVELESAVVPVPFAVERVDEGAVGSRGERAFVEVEVAPRV